MKNRLKPLPYMVLQDVYPHCQQARWLREQIASKLKRKLPTLHYSGWKHGFVPQWVKSHQKNYPYFFVADISKYYASIPHASLIVCGQLAYKYCVGTPFVPKQFSTSYVRLLHSWFASLPTHSCGIPLASKMSAALAPLFWVPLLREYKQNENLRFLVFADDILVISKNEASLEKAYFNLQNYVAEHHMQLNIQKLQQGKFGTFPMQFCGYRFAGGYVGIAPSTVENFKQRIEEMVQKLKDRPNYLRKRLNHQIKGFGHYYKYGNVKKIYTRLDSYIRGCVRTVLNMRAVTLRKYLMSLLRLVAIWEMVKVKPAPLPNKRKISQQLRSKPKNESEVSSELMLLNESLVCLVNQQKELIGLLKRQLGYSKKILNALVLEVGAL